ncbi:ABC transporter permease [Halobacteriales archaeon SW_7_71_33]|nr:MAG: ABC transporter permease [Halobacteriales archaeon SW_7_71_33]
MSRWSYVLKRLVLAMPVLVFALTVTFMILYLGPLDPVTAVFGQEYNPSDALQLRKDLGMVRADGSPVPLWEQYIDFMIRLFTFNFGQSWVVASEVSVSTLIWNKVLPTVWLGFWSVIVALVIGLPLGFYAGLNPNTGGDYLASFGGIVWRAMPNFWLAVILAGAISQGGFLEGYRTWVIETQVIGTPRGTLETLLMDVELLGVAMPMIDPTNFFAAVKWILPAALVLGSSSMGNEMRIGRTAVLETINSNYVETARAKGVSSWKIVSKHVFRNAMVPLLPVIMGEFYLLIGGSVLVELIFNINGLGRLFISAAFGADVTVLGALLFIFVSMTLVFNILQDILYTMIDPRVGYESE